ncbi:hypothetical protein [Glycomyces dulcitolivorans]|uniref:hypothetical protein n=1 Tax=Glycomyces dulcitolivorans TaxID=2200759 RepID=UPI0018E52A04|nr:hypothetical protein [Glycomyces dulcitolivorans]
MQLLVLGRHPSPEPPLGQIEQPKRRRTLLRRPRFEPDGRPERADGLQIQCSAFQPLVPQPETRIRIIRTRKPREHMPGQSRVVELPPLVNTRDTDGTCRPERTLDQPVD